MSLKGILKSTRRADRVLLFLFILLSCSGIIFVKEVLPKGAAVHIEVEGRLVYLLPIEKDRVVSVKGPEGKTVVEIKDRKVRITESPCPSKLCIRQGWIEYGAIVCIPNRIVVTIGKDKDANKKIIDAITG